MLYMYVYRGLIVFTQHLLTSLESLFKDDQKCSLSVPSAGSWWLHGLDVPGRCVLEMAAKHLSWYVVGVHSGVG